MNIEYHANNYIRMISNKLSKVKVVNSLHNKIDKMINPKTKISEIIYKDYKFLTKYNYDKNINIDDINQYTVLNVNIDVCDSLKTNAKECLINILKSKKILLNNKPVDFKQCVILDILSMSNLTITTFHTDIEYNDFTGNSFNVWYLTENKKNYGNIFLLDSGEYKKEYTPCCVKKVSNNKEISNYENNKIIDLYKHSFTNFITRKHEKIGELKNFKVIYTNMKNGECLIMSKHVIHKGDSRRNGNVNGFNFRVLVKNEDGSINYNKYYKASKKFPHHIWDRENKKIFGVDLFDFA